MFLPETHRRNLDIRQHAENTNIITTPPSSAQTRSSGPHHERVADPRCTPVASCSIGGCDPSSVITASLFCCAVHVSCVRCVARLARAAKKKNMDPWKYGQMVTMPDFLFDGVSSSLAEFTSIFFFNFFFFFFVRNPDTTNTTDGTRAVQSACYNQLDTTLYTSAACQQSRK